MNDGIMIAFLPSDGSWCQQDFPHMTLVYGGKIGEQSSGDFNSLIKDAISSARLTSSFSLNVTGVQELGGDTTGNPAVDALIFYPTPQLLLARQTVEKWNASQFSTFLPHATIGPAGSAAQIPYRQSLWPQNAGPDVSYDKTYRGLPSSLYFNRVAACWGEQQVIFNISDMSY